MLAPKDDLFGYAFLSVVIAAIVSILSLGFISGMIALYRKERPFYLALAGMIGNFLAICFVLVNKLG